MVSANFDNCRKIVLKSFNGSTSHLVLSAYLEGAREVLKYETNPTGENPKCVEIEFRTDANKQEKADIVLLIGSWVYVENQS